MVGSHQVTISWDPPATPNGVILNYTVLLNGEQDGVVTANVTMFTVTQLDPFTGYNISVQACNSAGCVENPLVALVTMEDGEYSSIYTHGQIHYCVHFLKLSTQNHANFQGCL